MATERTLFGFGDIVRQHPDWRPSRCTEKTLRLCENNCCGLVPCEFCLEFSWIPYGDYKANVATGSMISVQGQDKWQGTVSCLAVEAYWYRDRYDVCWFEVTVDGRAVHTISKCDIGFNSCRDPGDSVEIETYEYVPRIGTLTWSTVDALSLPRIPAKKATEYAGAECAKRFCDSCDCVCPQICLDFTKTTYGGGPGAACASSRLIDADIGTCSDLVPTWKDTITCGYEVYDISVSLQPNPYTHQCELRFSLTGASSAEGTATVRGDCQSLDVTWSVIPYGTDDTITIRVACSDCEGCKYRCFDPNNRICLNHGTVSQCCGSEMPVQYGLYGEWFEEADMLNSTCDPPANLFGEACTYESYGLGCCFNEGQASWLGTGWRLCTNDYETTLCYYWNYVRQVCYVPDTATGFLPLCENLMLRDGTYDESGYGETCGTFPPDIICLSPSNNCCDLTGDRPDDPMPDELEVSWVSCCGDAATTIGWDSALGAYVGSITVCGHTIDLRMTCVGELYRMVTQNALPADLCGGDLEWEANAVGQECLPFYATFIGDEPSNCCPAYSLDTVVITVSETV